VKESKKVKVSGLMNGKSFFYSWTNLLKNRGARKLAEDEPPIRLELYSSDQMEQHGQVLAGAHQLSQRHPSDRLRSRLSENEEVLVGTCEVLTEAIKTNRRITPAGEWLLDNFYLIEEQIHTAKRHLPKAYSRELPCLLGGPSAGLPRVYDLALETISHGDGRVDLESLSRFVAAYQKVAVLKLGELWAIPIMLRLALIENLRRVGVRITTDRAHRNLAGHWADLMMETAEKDPKSLILVIADMARSDLPMASAWVAEFSRRLQGQSSALALPLTWIEQRLAESGQTIAQMVQLENQQQAADQVSISNSIGSLRFIGAVDWREFVESMSIVEQTLREDPGRVYIEMDFATRDRYRHVVEDLSKRSAIKEETVARQAVELAKKSRSRKGSHDRTAHVGFYLIDKGLVELEQAAQVHPPPLERIQRSICRSPLCLYLGLILLLTGFFTWGLLEVAYQRGLKGWGFGCLGLLLVCAGSSLAVALTNWITSLLVAPHPLPRMDLSHGIPPELRTLVVVPTMLTDGEHIEALVEALEVRFLANRQDNLHFSLLTDFRDAREETTPVDESLVTLAQAGIKRLNDQYAGAKRDIFFLFHRPRRWNPRERIWMGYERKRGKLQDLNSFLRGGGSRNFFSRVEGETAVLANVKYVITLDTDTQLPREAVWQFVGTMAHPLNRARYDEKLERVVEGYGILQPRVAVSLPSVSRSRYARLSSSEPGIDPYTRAVSDVYQDLFGEGSFIGKGIYEVDAFQRSLDARFPEDQILSHDLLEGCYARSGLLSDVQLYEEYPARYSADISRRHRWIRGDWQLLRWLLPRVPGLDGHSRKNPLTNLSRWKLLDNLRRSLSPLALTLLFLFSWTALSPPWFWTLSLAGILLMPPVLAALLQIFQRPENVFLRQHLASVFHYSCRHFFQSLFILICLPYEAFSNGDAILRTLGRMLITHKNLLEWNPSKDRDHHGGTSLGDAYRAMWAAPLLATVTLICLLFFRPAGVTAALPLLGLWLVSPLMAWWMSQPLQDTRARLSDGQNLFLEKIARKTWAFFETFVGPEDHWLPPDNFQEFPVEAIAHRTSPTNIGLALLANLSACDFGYISAGQLLERTAHTFRTMETLERHRGHFYNWYDTRLLEPLRPLYVSTVDSGNLAGHLLTLRPGLLALSDQKILNQRVFAGLSITLKILEETWADEETGTGIVPLSPGNLRRSGRSTGSPLPSQKSHSTRSHPFDPLQTNLASLISTPPSTLSEASQALGRFAALAMSLREHLESTCPSRVNWWAGALVRQCQATLDELAFLAPWILMESPPAGLGAFPDFAGIPTLSEVAELESKYLPVIELRQASLANFEEGQWLKGFQNALALASLRAKARVSAIVGLALVSSQFANMEYEFLFDRGRHLLALGYNMGEGRRDPGHYDLLASEARLSSFVGIAQGQLPQESWFSLGRLLTAPAGRPTLLSWSGSMFEYLMPLLVMPSFENTLLYETCRAAVQRQIEYGRECGIPWGISESGYNAVDIHLNYQYRAFGVPGLGLKRGLAEDRVVAPYASVLALMVAPVPACLNLERLSREGVEGPYGFYEAVDFTPSRLPRGQTSTLIRSFMAHHQGMSFLALNSLLLENLMQKRFAADPMLQATLLLLQERIPKATASYSRAAGIADLGMMTSSPEKPMRIFTTPDTPAPELQLLSNGRYHVMVTNAGGGYSCWKGMAVTRWREDSTSDNWGAFCYLRDLAGREFWSTAYQPTLKRTEDYEVIFTEDRAEFRCRHRGLEMHTEITVSPEHDIELRRLRLTNSSRTARTLDVTSYVEVVLASAIADALHPAFSNLFVETEILRDRHTILCTRRPRSQNEQAPYLFHLMAVHGVESTEVSYETDRLRFIGRGNTIVNPQAISNLAALSNSEGSVLDPIAAIRYRLTLGPGESATINMVTGIGENREVCLGLVERYQDRRLANRVFDLALTHNQVILRQINATEADAQLYCRLASPILYAATFLRAEAGTLLKNRRGQSGLWGYSISGDLPIVLLKIQDPANIELVRQLVQAHAYWRLKGVAVDLVIWNEDHAGYRQILHDQIMGLIAAGAESVVPDRMGEIFVRASDQMPAEDRVLLETVARVILTDTRGSLMDQITPRGVLETLPVRFAPVWQRQGPAGIEAGIDRPDLVFFNGLGGFTPDGREYVITTAPGHVTPAPWVNVLANSQFGTVISESGSAYTWSENAHEFRITPWHNDPVSDPSGEAFYLRDEDSGYFWSPTPLPRRGENAYLSRHGFGYSVFEHLEDGIHSELWVYVSLDEPVKFMVLKIRNRSGRPRRLSITGYVEWVLGDLRPKTAMHVVTEVDAASGALVARNSYNLEFAGRAAFFNVSESNRSVSGDRTEFLGRNGTLNNPAAMLRVRLSGKLGAGCDPCAAFQVPFEIADAAEREVVFTLGAGKNIEEASDLARRLQGLPAAREVLEKVWQHWSHLLGAVNLDTPDPAINLLANGWLLYQTLACRLWARSGYYQSGGAFGFRDQLQDVMALLYSRPDLAREHLLVCAAHQFPEGDVQHWWHPPGGRGVRSHCSDDYLWLPWAVCQYVSTTGDTGILDEPVRFIQGRLLNPEEDSYYDLPLWSDESTSLYGHCTCAIQKGLKMGVHGLPLIGSGDWNDGMNMVGEKGKGESVWLGFFLYAMLTRFSRLALQYGDAPFSNHCEQEAALLLRNVEEHGWDGEWYRRAYFDDGSPLGSAGNPECQIDVIAQSWAVLSGAGHAQRSRLAMAAVNQRLVRREHRLIQLLDPPFDKSDLNPGYIKGYVPGVRENGGQYTHGAIWAAMAFAELGEHQTAWELMAMINPLNHSRSPEETALYKVEPYVAAADVYACPPHTGRGGWTWYTASGGWMYRLILESLLGMKLEVDKLRLSPSIPAGWPGFKLHYRYRETVYHISVLAVVWEHGEMTVSVDEVPQEEKIIPLVDDCREHFVEIKIPKPH
jgi:cyclic beta-1,2-glucan synthetase